MFRICNDHCKHCSNMKLLMCYRFHPVPVPRQPGQAVWERDKHQGEFVPPSLVPQTLTRAGRVWAQDYVPPWIMSWSGSVRLYCQKWKATLAYLSIQASTNDECEVLRRNAETAVQSVLAFEPYVPNGGSLLPHVRVVLDCF